MPDDDFGRRVSGVGALGEPVRRALYDVVVAAGDAPVSREQAATALGVPHHVVRFHLDRLVAAGLLDVEYRRLTGRNGPGAGRPAKLYRRADVEVAVSLPERRYDLAGHLMAEAIEAAARSGAPASDTLRAAAAARGREIGLRVRAQLAPADDAGPGAGVAAASAALAAQGYEPRAAGGEITLANCPFHALARDHAALVCGMNLALLSGLGEGLADGGVRARLDPAEGRCCVVLTVGPPPADGAAAPAPAWQSGSTWT